MVLSRRTGSRFLLLAATFFMGFQTMATEQTERVLNDDSAAIWQKNYRIVELGRGLHAPIVIRRYQSRDSRVVAFVVLDGQVDLGRKLDNGTHFIQFGPKDVDQDSTGGWTQVFKCRQFDKLVLFTENAGQSWKIIHFDCAQTAIQGLGH